MDINIISSPFIDILLQAYIDNLYEDINHLFQNFIYINLNTICNENQYYSDDDTLVQFNVKKYEKIDMPIVLSINTNINEHRNLENYNDLVDFIVHPFIRHFIAY